MKVYTGVISGASLETNADSAVDTITATAATIAGNVRSGQIMPPFGFLSRPVAGTKGVFLDQAGGMICVGASLEKLEKEAGLAEGASLQYSTDGDVIKGQVLVDADGLLSLKNEVTDLKTLIDGLIDTIIDLKVLGTAGTTPLILDPPTILAINTAKAEFSNLLK